MAGALEAPMADDKKEPPNQKYLLPFPHLRDRTGRLAIAGMLFGILCSIMARAPQIGLSRLPYIGDLPISIDAINAILFGPMILALFSWAIRYSAKNLRIGSGPWTRDDISIMRAIFLLFAVSTIFITLQYFIVLAPAVICASIPHFDFLWRTLRDAQPINHCMSGTEIINKHAFFYPRQIWIEAWAQVLLATVVIVLLRAAWRPWRDKVELAIRSQTTE